MKIKDIIKRVMDNNLVVEKDTKKAANVLRAVNHPLRRKILTILDYYEKVSVTDIYKKLKIGQSNASSHLAILRKEGIIDTQQRGKFQYYYIVRIRLDKINRYAKQLAGG